MRMPLSFVFHQFGALPYLREVSSLPGNWNYRPGHISLVGHMEPSLVWSITRKILPCITLQPCFNRVIQHNQCPPDRSINYQLLEGLVEKRMAISNILSIIMVQLHKQGQNGVAKREDMRGKGQKPSARVLICSDRSALSPASIGPRS